MKTLLLLLGGCAVATAGYGQNNRLTDHNTIGWLVYVGDHKLAPKWTLHTEYQARRVHGLRVPQNQLMRLGLGHLLTARVKVSGGYTYFQTFRYGAYPTVAGRASPEQRLYQDVTLSDPLGRLTLSHRLRLEQRWLGTRDDHGEGAVGKWTYQNRIRYQLAGAWALQGPTLDDGEWYLNAYDELFIGFGPNVQNNIFNQNRLSGGVGYQFTKDAKVELNYLHQISQHAGPDRNSGRPVFEDNQGFWLNVAYSLDFTRKAAP
ncbi:DUF2490 domain-containing protein [uncultured Hymenobacter sp.]|uniref:DUF2490 domain-containing protein n=1 Tax=uncultured Hymenobacter sp. TaxID=170016 RepID=UPI0035CC62D2